MCKLLTKTGKDKGRGEPVGKEVGLKFSNSSQGNFAETAFYGNQII